MEDKEIRHQHLNQLHTTSGKVNLLLPHVVPEEIRHQQQLTGLDKQNPISHELPGGMFFDVELHVRPQPKHKRNELRERLREQEMRGPAVHFFFLREHKQLRQRGDSLQIQSQSPRDVGRRYVV